MPKLREVLTQDEHDNVSRLRIKMLEATTKRESDFYKIEIEKIFEKAKNKYLQTLDKRD